VASLLVHCDVDFCDVDCLRLFELPLQSSARLRHTRRASSDDQNLAAKYTVGVSKHHCGQIFADTGGARNLFWVFWVIL